MKNSIPTKYKLITMLELCQKIKTLSGDKEVIFTPSTRYLEKCSKDFYGLLEEPIWFYVKKFGRISNHKDIFYELGFNNGDVIRLIKHNELYNTLTSYGDKVYIDLGV